MDMAGPSGKNTDVSAHGQDDAGVSGTGSRARLIGLLGAVLGAGLGTTFDRLDTPAAAQLIPPVIVVLGVAALTMAGGPAHRAKLGAASRWQRWAAWTGMAVLIGAYASSPLWAFSPDDNFWMAFLPTACLATATICGFQNTLGKRPPLLTSLMCGTCLLVGSSLTLYGVMALPSESQSVATLFGVAQIVVGVSTLLGAASLLAEYVSRRVHRNLLAATVMTSLGGGILSSANAFLLGNSGVLFAGTGLLISTVGLVVALPGLALENRKGWAAVTGFAGLLVAVAQFGIALWVGTGMWLYSCGVLLGGIATLLTIAAASGSRILNAPGILHSALCALGAALLLLGAQYLSVGNESTAAIVIPPGVWFAICGATLLWRPGWLRKQRDWLVTYLKERPGD